jgi:hypothetical protein
MFFANEELFVKKNPKYGKMTPIVSEWLNFFSGIVFYVLKTYFSSLKQGANTSRPFFPRAQMGHMSKFLDICQNFWKKRTRRPKSRKYFYFSTVFNLTD